MPVTVQKKTTSGRRTPRHRAAVPESHAGSVVHPPLRPPCAPGQSTSVGSTIDSTRPSPFHIIMSCCTVNKVVLLPPVRCVRGATTVNHYPINPNTAMQHHLCHPGRQAGVVQDGQARRGRCRRLVRLRRTRSGRRVQRRAGRRRRACSTSLLSHFVTSQN